MKMKIKSKDFRLLPTFRTERKKLTSQEYRKSAIFFLIRKISTANKKVISFLSATYLILSLYTYPNTYPIMHPCTSNLRLRDKNQYKNICLQ